MNHPFREPGTVDVNKTEIECAKIREAGETKRKLIEEREKTRRERSSNRKSILTEAGFQVMLTLSVVALATAAAIAGGLYVSHRWPSPPDPPAAVNCKESSEVIGSIDSRRLCDNGGYAVTKPLEGGKVLFNCKCGPRPESDGGL